MVNGDMVLNTAELDNWVIDRRPPDVPEEGWREMPRAKQDELFKHWKMNYPEEGDLFDQQIIAWFVRQDMFKKARAQEADARCRATLEREDAAAESVAPSRREQGGAEGPPPAMRPRPSAKSGETSNAPSSELPDAMPCDHSEAELDIGAD